MSQSNTVVELKAIAKSLGLTGYSNLRKDELIKFIQSFNQKKQEMKSSPKIKNGERETLNINGDRIYEYFYNNGNIKLRETFRDNNLIKVETFYQSGSKNSEKNYNYRKKEGKQSEWFENGTQKSEMNYKNDKLDGPQYVWDENEKLRAYEKYKNGLKEGQQSYYDEKGRLLHIDTYLNSEYVGTKSYF